MGLCHVRTGARLGRRLRAGPVARMRPAALPAADEAQGHPTTGATGCIKGALSAPFTFEAETTMEYVVQPPPQGRTDMSAMNGPPNVQRFFFLTVSLAGADFLDTAAFLFVSVAFDG